MQTRMSALAAVLLLAACSPPAAAPPTQEAAPAAGETAPAPQGDTPTPAQLVGRWGDNGDCSFATILNADGAYTMPDGSAGRWTLEGDRMTMTGAAGAFTVQVSILNNTQLLIGNPDGSIGISQRCP